MNFEKIQQEIVEAYHQALSKKLTNFAIMSPDDAHYIVLKYSGHIFALTDMALRGVKWAENEYNELTKIMDAPIRRFLVAIEINAGNDAKGAIGDQP